MSSKIPVYLSKKSVNPNKKKENLGWVPERDLVSFVKDMSNRI